MTKTALLADEALSRQLSKATSAFYHYAPLYSTDELIDKMLLQMDQVNRFDAACWLSYHCIDAELATPSVYIYHLPASFAHDFEHLLRPMISRSMQQLDMVQDEYSIEHLNIDMPPIDSYLTAFGVYHYSLHLTQFEQHIHLLALLHFSQQNSYATQQHQLHQFLLENAARAFALHLRLKLKNQCQYLNSLKAVCDRQGRIIASDANFETFMIEYQTKIKLIDLVSSKHLPRREAYGQYKIHISIENNLCLIEVYTYDSNIEQLSETETNVARHIIQGLTAQQIADLKGLSYKTITNQVDSIYKKLHVANNAELVSYLLTSDYCCFSAPI